MLDDRRRLVIAHNPHSSRASDVKRLVFDRLDEAGYKYETIEVRQAPLEENVRLLAPEIREDDVILSAAGDGSAHAVAHAVMAASQPGVELGFLAFGNFNDVPNTFNSSKSLRDPVAFLEQARPETVWPLEVLVDGNPLRSALLYVTVGWTAQAANRFDDPKLRHKIKNGGAGLIKSLWRLGWYYLKTRRQASLPPLRYDGADYKKTDLLFANGPSVARLFKTGKSYYTQPVFLFRMLNVRWLLPNIPFLAMGLLGRMRGEEVPSALVEFDEPSAMKLQCDGEVVLVENTTSIQVQKATEALTVLATNKK